MAPNTLGAVVLTSALETSVVEPTPRYERAMPARYARVPAFREPLDLTADVFRYLETIDGRVLPIHDRLERRRGYSLAACCRDCSRPTTPSRR